MIQELSDCGNWRIYGSKNPQILIAGHSHTFSMFMALQDSQKFSEFIGIVSQANFEDQKQIDQSYWKFVADQSKDKNLAIAWNGNQHNLNFLINTKVKFNSYGLDQGSNHPFVTISQIEELYKPTFDDLEKALGKVSSAREICLLGTPSPKSEKFLNQRLANDQFFMNLGEQLGLARNEIRASNDKLRTFMWSITQELTQSIAIKNKYKFLPTPIESYDKNRLLLEKFSEDDLTHANPVYGLMMLEKISEFFGVSVGR